MTNSTRSDWLVPAALIALSIVPVAFGTIRLAELTGLWMAHSQPWPEGDGELLYLLRLGFGSAMAVSIDRPCRGCCPTP